MIRGDVYVKRNKCDVYDTAGSIIVARIKRRSNNLYPGRERILMKPRRIGVERKIGRGAGS